MAHRGRRPATRPATTGLQPEFEKHTESVYVLMKFRVSEKKNTAGIITQVGRPLPFTLREFREWLLAGPFAGSWDKAVQCSYCRRWLNASNFVTDHREPLKYGGSLDFDNLAIACADCNNEKGVMSEAGYRALMAWVGNNLNTRDAADMLGRMKGSLHQKIVAMHKRKAAGVRGTSRNFVMPPLIGGRS